MNDKEPLSLSLYDSQSANWLVKETAVLSL